MDAVKACFRRQIAIYGYTASACGAFVPTDKGLETHFFFLGLATGLNRTLRPAQCHRRLHGRRRRVKIAAWVADFNTARPHSALGYLTRAAYAANFTATDDRLRNSDQLRRSPVVPSAPHGVKSA